jgi:hypothetical protein
VGLRKGVSVGSLVLSVGLPLITTGALDPHSEFRSVSGLRVCVWFSRGPFGRTSPCRAGGSNRPYAQCVVLVALSYSPAVRSFVTVQSIERRSACQWSTASLSMSRSFEWAQSVCSVTAWASGRWRKKLSSIVALAGDKLPARRW